MWQMDPLALAPAGPAHPWMDGLSFYGPASVLRSKSADGCAPGMLSLHAKVNRRDLEFKCGVKRTRSCIGQCAMLGRANQALLLDSLSNRLAVARAATFGPIKIGLSAIEMGWLGPRRPWNDTVIGACAEVPGCEKTAAYRGNGNDMNPAPLLGANGRRAC